MVRFIGVVVNTKNSSEEPGELGVYTYIIMGPDVLAKSPVMAHKESVL